MYKLALFLVLALLLTPSHGFLFGWLSGLFSKKNCTAIENQTGGNVTYYLRKQPVNGTGPFVHGTKVKVTCADGKHPTGGPDEAKCKNGKWHKTLGKCQ